MAQGKMAQSRRIPPIPPAVRLVLSWLFLAYKFFVAACATYGAHSFVSSLGVGPVWAVIIALIVSVTTIIMVDESPPEAQ
jgi:hypothetical protein